MHLSQITILAALTLFNAHSHAIANDVYRIKLRGDSNIHYFAGPLTPVTDSASPNIYVQYYVKGYTDPGDPAQYKRIPFENIRSASFDRDKVLVITTDSLLIEGTHGYAFCISGKDSVLGSSGCPPGKIRFAASTEASPTISTMMIRDIEKIEDNEQRSSALRAIEQGKLRIEGEKEREKEREKQAAIEHSNQFKALKLSTEKFRKELEAGDQTNCGMVIQAKPPIVKIQTMIGEYWIRIDQVFPADIECKFVNKIYQPPQL